MIRSLFVFLFVTSAAYSAPNLKDRSPAYYFPIQVGAKRVLEYSTGVAGVVSRETVETITNVEQKDGVYLVTVATERAGVNVAKAPTSVLAVSEKGVSRVKSMDRDLPNPIMMLKLPAKSGDSWEVNGLTYKVGKEEEIEVPAGKFKAIPVSFDQGAAANITTTSWYAPKVGLIKTVMKLNGTDRTTVLKSFTPGK